MRMGEGRHLLHVIGKADQQRTAPMPEAHTVREAAVIETLAHADAMAGRIETHQRHEDDVQFTRGAHAVAAWFENSERAGCHRAIEVEEMHAPVPAADDAGQRDDAATPLRDFQQRCGIQLVRHGDIQTDAAARAQQASGIDESRKATGGKVSRASLDGAAAGAQFAAQCDALVSREGRCSQLRDPIAERMKKRHPRVPVRTVALEPEQQVGRAIVR